MGKRKSVETCEMLPDHGCGKNGCFGKEQVKSALSRLRRNREGAILPTYDGMLEVVNTCARLGCPNRQILRNELRDHYHDFPRVRGVEEEPGRSNRSR